MIEINGYENAKNLADKNWDSIASEMPPELEQKAEKLIQELRTSPNNLFDKLKNLYVYMDELYSFVAKFTPCKKGCSLCCHNEVSISVLEAEYIEKYAGIKQNTNLTIKDSSGTPCPLLVDGACSIYQYRPFVCRRHVALFDDPKWCKHDLPIEYVFPQIRFYPVEESYAYVVVSSGITTTHDIRQVFSPPSENDRPV